MVVGQDNPPFEKQPEPTPRPRGIVHKLTTPRVATLDDTIQALQDLKRSGAPGDTPIGVTYDQHDLYKKAKELQGQKGRAMSDEQHNAIKRAEIRYWVEYEL